MDPAVGFMDLVGRYMDPVGRYMDMDLVGRCMDPVGKYTLEDVTKCFGYAAFCCGVVSVTRNVSKSQF